MATKTYNCPTSSQKTIVSANINREALREINVPSATSKLFNGNKGSIIVDAPVFNEIDDCEYKQDIFHIPDVADITVTTIEPPQQEGVRAGFDVHKMRAKICKNNNWDWGICLEIFNKGAGEIILTEYYFTYLKVLTIFT